MVQPMTNGRVIHMGQLIFHNMLLQWPLIAEAVCLFDKTDDGHVVTVP